MNMADRALVTINTYADSVHDTGEWIWVDGVAVQVQAGCQKRRPGHMSRIHTDEDAVLEGVGGTDDAGGVLRHVEDGGGVEGADADGVQLRLLGDAAETE